MKHHIPWTKTLLEDYISEALLNEEEEKIVRTRLAGWSIIKQSMEFGISTSTVSKLVAETKKKYDQLSDCFPERFPKRKRTIYEVTLDEGTQEECDELFGELTLSCGKDLSKMSAKQLIECQRSCPYKEFYRECLSECT